LRHPDEGKNPRRGVHEHDQGLLLSATAEPSFGGLLPKKSQNKSGQVTGNNPIRNQAANALHPAALNLRAGTNNHAPPERTM